MKVLDLFSGLGGFSEAFVKHGHEVLRIDNNPLLSEVPNTQIIDIFAFRDELVSHIAAGHTISQPDVILAAPPCLQFSNAYHAPKSIAARNNQEYNPNMDLLNVALEIINLLKPKWWVIENVVGSIKYFQTDLGSPRQKIGAFVFWGNFPMIHVLQQIPTKSELDKRHSPLRSNYRAQIPLPVSMGLLTAILEQTYITDWV